MEHNVFSSVTNVIIKYSIIVDPSKMIIIWTRHGIIIPFNDLKEISSKCTYNVQNTFSVPIAKTLFPAYSTLV